MTLQTFKLLGQHRLAFTSITENIDYSTPEGTLFLSLLGRFSQYFSDALAWHTSKGIKQRVLSGFHNGSVPFGYIKCDDGCKAGIHPEPKESEAVCKMFELYASGSWSLRRIAGWLNDQGFLTRNTKRLTGPGGTVVSGPQRFTTASVRWILHNSFFTGKVKHREQEFPGLHQGIVQQALFDAVQQRLNQACGRSHTVSTKYRFYALKGLARCVYCGLPLWAETTKGRAYYREQGGARAQDGCPAHGKVIRTEVVESQMGELMRNIALQPTWRNHVLSRLAADSEYVRVTKDRQQVQERLRRLGKAYVDNLVSENDYEMEKRVLEARLESLVVPEVEAAFDAASLIENLKALWEKATAEERRKILMGMLDAVYVDLAEGKGLVGVSPKPVFKPLFESAESKQGATVRLIEKRTPDPFESGVDGLLW